MDENQQENTQTSKSNVNPLLVVVILIIVAAVGVMLWLGSNKTATKAAMTKVTVTPTQAMMKQEEPTSSASSGKAATQSATDDKTMGQAITVEAGSFYFKPNVIKVKKGEKVTITISNKGGFHDFIIDEFNVKSKNVPSGQTTTVEFTPTKTGSFEFYCGIGNHRAMGMKGTLVVE